MLYILCTYTRTGGGGCYDDNALVNLNFDELVGVSGVLCPFRLESVWDVVFE